MSEENYTKKNSSTKWLVGGALTVVIILLIGGAFVFGNFMATKGFVLQNVDVNALSSLKEQGNIDKYSDLFEVRNTILSLYDGEIDDEKLLEGAIKGMAYAVGDPYTNYMNADEFKEFMSDGSGELTGIGIEIGIKDGYVTVVSPMEGSPAERAGIKAGDKIIAINGEVLEEASTSLAASKVRGEAGTEVTITFLRGESEKFDKTIVREKIEISPLEAEYLGENVGYIKLNTFLNENAATLFSEAIEKMKNDGAKGLILDLRGNSGGYLDQAVKIASQFVPEGKTITYTIDKYDNKKVEKSVKGNAVGMPLVILIDGGSASASEVVTGALRDYDVATTIGTTSFGKGIVQQVVGFNNGSGLRITVSRYYTPNGENIHGTGIQPDIEVEYPKELLEQTYDRNTDPQFQKALEVIKSKF